MWPTFSPIDIQFDKEKLKNEILKSKILDNGLLATTHQVDGENFWNNKINFKDSKFKKLKNTPLWKDENKLELTKSKINTFYQLPITSFDDKIMTDVWEGEHHNKSKIPLWIKYNYQWSIKNNIKLPYLESIVGQLNLNFYSMIRIVYQIPPSIGIIHKDSGPKTNLEYYNQGGSTITLNVCSGGANLYFLDNDMKEHFIDENRFCAWHFDDSKLHCTTEVSDIRIQIRIYGNHTNYRSLMNLKESIY